jgi:hypothetical protein
MRVGEAEARQPHAQTRNPHTAEARPRVSELQTIATASANAHRFNHDLKTRADQISHEVAEPADACAKCALSSGHSSTGYRERLPSGLSAKRSASHPRKRRTHELPTLTKLSTPRRTTTPLTACMPLPCSNRRHWHPSRMRIPSTTTSKHAQTNKPRSGGARRRLPEVRPQQRPQLEWIPRTSSVRPLREAICIPPPQTPHPRTPHPYQALDAAAHDDATDRVNAATLFQSPALSPVTNAHPLKPRPQNTRRPISHEVAEPAGACAKCGLSSGHSSSGCRERLPSDLSAKRSAPNPRKRRTHELPTLTKLSTPRRTTTPLAAWMPRPTRTRRECASPQPRPQNTRRPISHEVAEPADACAKCALSSGHSSSGRRERLPSGLSAKRSASNPANAAPTNSPPLPSSRRRGARRRHGSTEGREPLPSRLSANRSASNRSPAFSRSDTHARRPRRRTRSRNLRTLRSHRRRSPPQASPTAPCASPPRRSPNSLRKRRPLTKPIHHPDLPPRSDPLRFRFSIPAPGSDHAAMVQRTTRTRHVL